MYFNSLCENRFQLVEWGSSDLIQVDLNDLVVLAAFIWYQQISVIISQGSNIWVEIMD